MTTMCVLHSNYYRNLAKLLFTLLSKALGHFTESFEGKNQTTWERLPGLFVKVCKACPSVRYSGITVTLKAIPPSSITSNGRANRAG
ncbi:hypothetical protein RHMOL_Rhmol04G0203700 [Rhododendron molle]|uniref:Uncharacterized protein n=1 Tax=Rhododendron molle TaxID=49168 RepID=A0ACC0P2N7_RHOML|nr:hypothetical protein RHMOL_Rhmol04G0203700 [Rhododendron molle]